MANLDKTVAQINNILNNALLGSSALGKNLYNKDAVITGKYINATNGGLDNFANATVSPLIPIVPDTIYYLTRENPGTREIRFVAANGITPILPINPLTGLPMPTYASSVSSLAIKSPSNAAYFQATVMFSGNGNPDTVQFELGNAPTTFEAYRIRREMYSDNLPLNVIKAVTDIALLNPLYGKILSINGDSIPAGTHAGSGGGYGKLIADKNAMIFENKAVGGGTITGDTMNGETPRHWICRTIDTMSENADYILLEGGVNDIGMVTFGAISSGYTASLDDATFCGAFESMLKQSIARWPGKKIGFVFVHRMVASADFDTTYYPAMISMLQKWGIPYCDLHTQTPSLNFIAALKTAYTFNQDGWHPTQLGYEKFYCDKIEAFMKSL